VTIPTVDPNDEGGDDDSEIIIAANDSIIEDDGGDGESSSESTSSTGTTTAGGSTAGGSTGNTTPVVDSGDDGSGRDVEDVNVEDDESIVGLVGAQRTGASLLNFNSGDGAPSSAAAGAGSNMVLGAPKRTTTRGLAVSPDKKAVVNTPKPPATDKKVVRASASTKPDEVNNSSLAKPRSREQIREDLKRRGLIK
jgi:hypothetical protein